jgi:hypothetical protein
VINKIDGNSTRSQTTAENIATLIRSPKKITDLMLAKTITINPVTSITLVMIMALPDVLRVPVTASSTVLPSPRNFL